MPRFDDYANPESVECEHAKHLQDVPSDCIDHLSTRVVLPLRREAAFGPRPRNQNRLLQIADNAVILDTAALGVVPLSELRQAVGDLCSERAQIQEALDTMFGAH